MLIYFITFEETKEYNLDIANIMQLLDYFRNFELETYKLLTENEYIYLVGKRDSNEKFHHLSDRVIQSDLSNYDILVISEKVEGATGIEEAIAAAATAVAGATGLSVQMSTLLITSLLGSLVSTALNFIMQALSPTKDNIGDPSQKNFLFDGIQNIDSQGGSIPLIFGETAAGGVTIGKKLDTHDIHVGTTKLEDNVHHLTEITGFAYENNVLVGKIKGKTTTIPILESTWYRLA